MRVAFFTLGCKVNQYETQILEQQFLEHGFDVVDCSEPADVYIINSCTVTATGDKKTRQMLHRFKKLNSAAIIALTGCFPQAYPQDAAALADVDIVTGSYNRAGLIGAVKQFLVDGKKIVDITPHRPKEAFEPMRADRFLERTRAFVKIQDGCDRYCSYCIIPTARGPVRSKAPADLKEELEGLAEKGYKEVVLVGINLSLYGKEYGLRLIDAVEIACRIPGIERVRLGSLEPELLTDDDLARMAKLSAFCPQFHLSLQSGCTETLARMNRHYTADEYKDLVRRIRAHFDNAAITTDLMVGFPGEDEQEFETSCRFVEEVGFAKVHAFAYSRRPGTKADKMPDQVTQKVKEERNRRLIAVSDKVRQTFLQSQIGKTVRVLLETHGDERGIFGYSENYTPVYVKTDRDLHGKIISVRLTQVSDDACLGEIMEEIL